MFYRMKDRRVEALAGIDLFGTAKRRDLARLGQATTGIAFEPGAEVMRQGSLGYEAVLITSGELAVHADGADIGVIGEDELIGEIAVLRHVRRTASVSAITPVKGYVLAGPEFRGLMETAPSVRDAIDRLMDRRLAARGGPVV